MLRHSYAGWSNPKVLTILALIFCCGVALGSLVTSTFLHRTMGMHEARQFGLQNLKRELNLTPDQERTVTKELDDYAKYYQNIEEQREDVAELGKRRILAILTREQQKRFLEMFKSTPLPTRVELLR